jgi:DNA invertase Pin-like site-specific DNA recombinase
MNDTMTGYARCSTLLQDLTAQRQALAALGVPEDRIYTDEGLTGTNRDRPGLDQALAAVRSGETLVVPKLDRLARNVPDARDIIMALAQRGVKFQLGGSVYDWDDPMSKCFLQMLAVFAEFEVDLLKLRTREGMAIARAKGHLKGRAAKLSPTQQKALVRAREAGEENISELAKSFKVSRATVYRVLAKAASLVKSMNGLVPQGGRGHSFTARISFDLAGISR